jgi:type IV pilus assembly protein PilA
MLANLKARRRDEEGFTLIELMVVVLIIAILIAIAIPTFLGARQRAQDRAAQSSVRNAVTAGKTIFTDNENYAGATDAALTDVEPSLTFTGAASTAPKEVHTARLDQDGDGLVFETLVVVSKSNSGKCFWMKDVGQDTSGSGGDPAGTFYAADDAVAGACDVADGDAAANPAWNTDGF